jgi:hypothetical protein
MSTGNPTFQEKMFTQPVTYTSNGVRRSEVISTVVGTHLEIEPDPPMEEWDDSDQHEVGS